MTDAAAVQPKAPLGVGSIISESFSILFGNIVKITIVAFVPTLLGFIISGLLSGFDVALGITPADFSNPSAGIGQAVALLINMVVYAITTALLVQLAYDAKLVRPIQIGRYVGPAIKVAFPLAIQTIVVSILLVIGMLFLIIPGLWVYGVFAVVAPVVVIERVGFGGMGRSARLTKEYRWPIIGAVVLAIILTSILQFVAIFLAGLVAISGTVGMVIAVVIFVAISALGAGFLSVLVSLIYARLREIKEGVSVDQIAAVFD